MISSKYTFIIEPEAFEGVKRIALKVAQDFKKVCGALPKISEPRPGFTGGKNTIIFATIGKSPITDKLISKGKFNPSAIKGKREVFQIKMIDNETLLVCGSDKRGTIYGMFALSEFIGVSPLHFWGDAEPLRKNKIEITKKIETVSKEPSVKYRGIFINDEWPCFGSWTFNHFKGFNAEMYEHVFELILRLKGNYLWPAMWSASFALDGPGILNEELADIYGVIIGSSHHEPCLRASEEWDKVRGPKSVYGNEWNYYTNKKGLLRYWEDGLIRSGKYENLITLGMRGERDSSILGGNSTLKDNIDLLKDIIINQRELIKKHVNQDINSVPQVMALYKEVEEYFNGDEKNEGLISWKELDGVTFLLCDDNFGFIRTLPEEKIRTRKGGFGMYYHFDYHGGPISYEWMPSTTFERTWEQMCMAYDYGARDIWVINAGDLKFNEVPLAYFMELAYDFDKWGTAAPNSIRNYTSIWLEKTFPAADSETRNKMSAVLHGYINLNSIRRPEAINPEIYHPCHYLEADRMLNNAEYIDLLNEDALSELTGNEKDAYYSMIYIPAKASINLLRMHIYAGKNNHYAKQGKKIANYFSSLVSECIGKDYDLAKDIAAFKKGKWKGMELSQHIGFVKWNSDNCRYPLRIQVEPANKPRMVVSRKDREEIYTKTYGNPMTIKIHDFLYAGSEKVILEIANDGTGCLNYTIESDKQYDWLHISSIKGTVESQEDIIISCDRNKITSAVQTARILIKDGETTVAAEIKAKAIDAKELPPMTYLSNSGVIAIHADKFCAKKDVQSAGFIELKNSGRNGSSMKVFPTTVDFGEKDKKPSLTYRFLIEEAGEHIIKIKTTPTNPVQSSRSIHLSLSYLNNEKIIATIPADYKPGSYLPKDWSKGVLNNIRSTETSLAFEKGVQEITIGALEAGLVLERILIYKKSNTPLQSYLGPPESYHTKN